MARGHAALATSRWEDARAAFEEALRLEETPEALEGLGMAAFWLDDVAPVFQARERAYRLYRSHGDRRAAARVAMCLADDCLNFRGEPAVARGWLQRASRLLRGLALGPEQGWLKLWNGYFGLVLGDDPLRVKQAAVAGAACGRRLGDVDLEMTGLALEGVALVMMGELDEGMPRLDEATAAVVSGEMMDPVAIGRCSCLLVLACERMRDFERAAQWCRRLEELSERMRFGFPLAICRTHYAGILTWWGSWDEAERTLETVLRQPAAVRPALQQDALLRLAELRRVRGRLDEAEAILQRIERHPLATLGRASLAMDRGEPAAAAHLAGRFLRQLPALDRTDRIAALEVLLRARLALGNSEARVAAEELQAIASRVGTEPIRASALVAEALVAAADGDHERARRSLEDAIALFGRSRASLEAARCRLDLARSLAALGEKDAADSELHEARRAFDRLGARLYADAAAALRRDIGSIAGRGWQAPAHAPALTPREVEVLRLVAQGMTNQEIGARLGVSEFTVKRHVANLLGKLSVPSRAAAAALAAREGFA